MNHNKGEDPHNNTYLTSVISKDIMRAVRDGDYQHAGDTEAIDLVFKKIENSPQNIVLDVGCGYGGTALYIQNKRWVTVIGIDINYDVISIAQSKYPNINFIHSDVLDVKKNIENKFASGIKLDVICLFNSFFLFSNQALSLQELSRLAKPSTKLLIFDYIDYGNYNTCSYTENGRKLLPNVLIYNNIEPLLDYCGWKSLSIEKIDQQYMHWYEELLEKIYSKKNILCQQYGKEKYDIFSRRYKHILESLRTKALGGIIIVATKK